MTLVEQRVIVQMEGKYVDISMSSNHMRVSGVRWFTTSALSNNELTLNYVYDYNIGIILIGPTFLSAGYKLIL